jgi:hypothetical protein
MLLIYRSDSITKTIIARPISSRPFIFNHIMKYQVSGKQHKGGCLVAAKRIIFLIGFFAISR